MELSYPRSNPVFSRWNIEGICSLAPGRQRSAEQRDGGGEGAHWRTPTTAWRVIRTQNSSSLQHRPVHTPV